MKIHYFEDTDTALLDFGGGIPAETRELSEDIYLDFDAAGNIVSITMEHASMRSDFSEMSFKRIPKQGKTSTPVTSHG